MGVLGLWDVLESVGHPVKVEGLEGKVLGVDANIWLYKFIRGFREKDNATNIDSHKLGLFNRLAKLLFYRIKPVFVFDGPAPVLKRRTLERRQNTRNKHLSKVQDAALRALANQLKSQYPNADIDQLRITLPELRSNNLVAAEKLGEEDFDLFYLPPEVDKKKDKNGHDDDNDEDGNTDDQGSDSDDDGPDGNIQYSTKVDVNSEDFEKLPPEVRYEILHDIKESRRRIRNAEALPDDAGSFSSFQLERLNSRRKIQEKIEKCEKDICTNYTGELADGTSIQAFRVQSDATSTILYRNNTYDPKALDKLKKEEEEKKFELKRLNDERLGQSISRLHNEDHRPLGVKSSQITTQGENSIDITEAADDSNEAQLERLKAGPTTREEVRTGEKVTGTEQADKLPSTQLAQAQRHLSDKISTALSRYNTYDPKSVEKIKKGLEGKEKLGPNSPDSESSDSVDLTDEDPVKSVSPIDTTETDNQKQCDIILVESDLDTSSESSEHDAPNSTIDLCTTINTTATPKSKSDSPILEELLSDDESSSGSSCELLEHHESSKDEEKKNDERNRVYESVSSSSDEFTDVDRSTDQVSKSQPMPEEQKTVQEKPAPLSQDISMIQSSQSARAFIEDYRPARIIEGSQMTAQSEHIMNAQRSTNKVTGKIIDDAKELLRLFGVPYIDATGEAEAQCAKLEELKLTAGTITDDSDIWLFGSQNVYRYFFSDDKYVMQYKMTDIEYHIRMTRENLACFAMLVGSDYTDGIMNVGPVTALEILSEFPGEGIEPLVKFKEWHQEALKDKKKTGDKKRKKLLKFKLPDEFPSRAVYDGYLRPFADSSTDAFTWGTPELDELREYARRNFGWDQKKIDEKLLPVMKKLSEKKIQKTIDTFFFKTQANRNPEMFRSKRVNQALNKIAKRAALDVKAGVVNLSDDDDDEDNDS